ncbi:16S rRNA pseudouridine(516) synthase RsuA [Psychromonas sp. PT13]|uniref:16S rRNA pseudouridine(516) synthase RsuA n=1 Tax=Psychromonas sp. PT13 TaxID=3439547 RepID=UPI003EBF8FE3
MRLDKYICQATSLTRSQAKKVISQGRVTNGTNTIRNTTYKVTTNETIFLNDKALSIRGPRYIMLNKPQGYICSTVDEQLPSVLNLLDVEKRKQLFIAGRLDADTTGLTLITDDGQWSHQITSPRKKCAKRYRVILADELTEDASIQFQQGIQLKSENQPCLPASLINISNTEVLLTISEGKYHQVKRMFAALGNHVTALHREKIGEIELDPTLQLGEWRYLTDIEVQSIA